MDDNEVRRSSDVLDAIFEKVSEKPERSDAATMLFRARALDQLDVATEVDNQLPLVSRRNWLLLAGVALLVLAFAIWASLTPSVSSVTAGGRIMSAPGAAALAAPVSGVLTDVAPAGRPVSAGAAVATVLSDAGPVPVRTAVDGLVWQQPVVPGSTVIAGTPVVTLLPPGSGTSALLPVPETQAASIVPGMKANVSGAGAATGTVSAITGPFTAQQAGERTGVALPDGTTYMLVSIALDAQLPVGSEAFGTVTLSDGTVLTRLLGRT